MAAEFIDDTETGSGLYPTKIPGYADAADIQEALRLYHYGSTTIPTTSDLNGTATSINTKSVAGHLKSLANADSTHAALTLNVHGIANTASLATQTYVTDAINNITDGYSVLAGDGIDWNADTDQFDIADSILLVSPKEKINISATAATGTLNIDTITSSFNVITSNATGNYTINVRGDSTNTLNSLMQIGDSITVVFESPNGSTAYYATGYTIDGNSVTPKWLGGTAPSAGNINATDVYMLQIRKISNATFTCLASQSKFA
jgi:hypothetical protein